MNNKVIKLLKTGVFALLSFVFYWKHLYDGIIESKQLGKDAKVNLRGTVLIIVLVIEMLTCGSLQKTLKNQQFLL